MMKEKSAINLASVDPTMLDEETRELLKQVLRQQITQAIAEQQKKAVQDDKNRLAGVELAKSHQHGQKLLQARCTHEKPKGLGNRWFWFKTSKGQLMAICSWCQKSYFTPPGPEQERIPQSVLKYLDSDNVGGTV